MSVFLPNGYIIALQRLINQKKIRRVVGLANGLDLHPLTAENTQVQISHNGARSKTLAGARVCTQFHNSPLIHCGLVSCRYNADLSTSTGFANQSLRLLLYRAFELYLGGVADRDQQRKFNYAALAEFNQITSHHEYS